MANLEERSREHLTFEELESGYQDKWRRRESNVGKGGMN